MCVAKNSVKVLAELCCRPFYKILVILEAVVLSTLLTILQLTLVKYHETQQWVASREETESSNI